MSIFLFLLVLFVLVLVHEWGHYITAKKTGMRVDEFAIGFPPRLFGIKRGETDFNFNQNGVPETISGNSNKNGIPPVQATEAYNA